jgi:gliding motility-associatede transport system auxiliary component
MKISRHIHQTLRLRSLLTTTALLILLSMLAWVSYTQRWQRDLTHNTTNTLSEGSIAVLNKLADSIHVKAFISDPTLQQQIRLLIARYQRHKRNILLEFIDPQQSPALSKQYKIGNQGAIVVSYQQRFEKLSVISESTLTNKLLQLAGKQNLWITFITGHGEPSATGQANFDLGLFAAELTKRGMRPQTINLTQVATIPNNSALLVLTNPTTSLLPAELNIISDYLAEGGNLLLLTEPDSTFLKPVEQQLAISKWPGTIVDTQSGLYGINDPTFVVSTHYPAHPLLNGFANITLFPGTAALAFNSDDTELTFTPLLSSVAESWTETGQIAGKIRFDADTEEQQGPLTFAVVLTREISEDKQQRIIVCGDGDFLSNAYLNNAGNLELGLRMINWLSANDQFIDIPVRSAPGKNLQLGNAAIALISFGFLIILPILLLAAGLLIRYRRKQR